MARDYAREYAARKALEQERARAEQRPYEPGRARGHRDPAEERVRGRIRYWVKRNARLLSLDEEEYRAIIDGAILTEGDDYQARAAVLASLKAQRAGIADPLGVGRDRFNNRPLWLPIEMFYYHAGEGTDTGEDAA